MELENKSGNLKKHFTKQQRLKIQQFIDRLLWEGNIDQTAGFQSDVIDDFVLQVNINARQGVLSVAPMGAIRLMSNSNELSMSTTINISNVDNLERIEVIKYFMMAILHFKYHVFKLHNETDDERQLRELSKMENSEKKEKLLEKMRKKRMEKIKNEKRDPETST